MGMCCSLHLTPDPVAEAQRTRQYTNTTKHTRREGTFTIARTVARVCVVPAVASK